MQSRIIRDSSVTVPSRSELLESDSRGFRTYWLVQEDYRIEDGLVKPLASGKPVDVTEKFFTLASLSRYLPMTRPELPFEFAKLARADDADIVQFVRRYGLLGYREAFETTLSIYKTFEFLATTPRGEEDKPPEKIPDFSRFFHEGINDGDPLAWVVSHAKTVNFVLELHDALKDKRQLKAKLEELKIHTVEYGDWPIEYRYAQRGELYPECCKTKRGSESDFEFAGGIIECIVNANLKGGISRELLIDLEPENSKKTARQNTLISTFQANSLIDCIYWHLADAIAGSTVKRCLYCKRFFNATHLKRLYCPPPMGLSGEGSCAQNDRAKRLRAKPQKLKKNRRKDGRQHS